MKWLTVALTLCLSSSALAVDTSAPHGAWTLLDQHEQAYTLNDATRVLLVARSMSTAKLVNASVGEQPAGYLEERGVIYVADIEKMPGVAKMVMLPAMRSANYRIVLDQTGAVAGRYGGDRDSVQWLELKDGQVVREQRFSEAEPLRQALAQLPR
ncbi:hypothetical protein [Pseudomonas cremoricolorata]|uniref:FAD/FMN-containing dehydrogenase n=1 Tax=Pseudomonas cremoricolorata TaxID=157783 RepID=A0A089YHC9_9PSED|nr:hypothetical protein [Pseudomonas cremoricolorata]AIR91093.1 hypothetical protein LK03_18275 [Pseudomonas cremoricolorata]